MLKVQGTFQSAYPTYKATPISAERTPSLEVLLDDYRKESFQVVGLDLAEICDTERGKTYTSPVILLLNSKNGQHAVVSKRPGIFETHPDYTVYTYEPGNSRANPV